MLNEKKQQAKNLFFQTDLTKTQIAAMLNISRRSLGYWVKEGDWNRLKHSAKHLPSMLAENCYHIIGHLTESYLSERRITNPVTYKEIDGLHKLTMTANKLKNRNTINDSMEMFGFFMEMLKDRNSKLADEVMPYIDEYMSSRAAIYTQHVQPDSFNHLGRIPWSTEPDTEKMIDNREAFFNNPDTIETYEKYGIPMPSEEEISTLPPCEKPQSYTLQQRNADNAEKARAFSHAHEVRQAQQELEAIEEASEPIPPGASATVPVAKADSPVPTQPELIEDKKDEERRHIYTYDEMEKLLEEVSTWLPKTPASANTQPTLQPKQAA